MALSREFPAPHHDPHRWGELIDSFDAAGVFVVIASWIGPRWRPDLSVEDVWQETLWMAWRDRHQHQWVDLARYRAWLLSIARNRVHDMVRAAARGKRGGNTVTARFSDLGGPDTVGALLPGQSTTPSRTASHLERARLFERVLAALPEELADMVRLRVFEEVSTQEAANRLRIPLSTAKHRLVRGMQAYREGLARELGTVSGAPPAAGEAPAAGGASP
jgi:RNA polymerase sigma factor (sigma-70 family)